MSELRTGVLLANLGTPDSPRVSDVRRYLREFLGDPRVLDMAPLPRWLLLNLVILPTRPRRSARAYAKIWTAAGSPLRFHGNALREAVSVELGPHYVVELGMRYGQPSIPGALERLTRADVARIIALPLFPQYAAASTGSTVEKILETLERVDEIPPVETLGPFYDVPAFISAFTASARPELEAFRPDFVVFSFHGLPERHLRRADRSGRHCLASDHCCDGLGESNRGCYRAQCFSTARALARALELEVDRFSVGFQSRLGPARWIRPHTDRMLPRLAASGVKRLAVLCPSFVADCLETLEEIGIRGRKQWLALGGEDLLLAPSLNASPLWVRGVADLIRAAA